MLLWLVLSHAVVGLAILAAAPWLRGRAFAIGALPMVGVLAFVASRWDSIATGSVTSSRATWIDGLDLVIDARLDGFAALMTLLVAGMGVLVLTYGRSYFDATSASARIAGLLVLFAGSMLGLVLADHLIWLYACWELTSVTSYLLIGRDQRTAGQRAASLQALLVTGAGGLAMLAGFILIGQAGGTWSLSELLADPPSGTSVEVGLVLVLAGIFTKSAQFPFHFWLPGAMVAPTPISAYLHSATMVKAGIYLAARFAPAFATVGFWRPLVIGLGLVTMIGGALRALRQDDLKLLLAHGTVSQLGFMMVLAGTGEPKATKAVCVLLVAHALFKGAMFLVVGIVDHQTGTRVRGEIAGLRTGWTTVRIVAVVSAASMAGLPPLAGFIAKESAYEAFLGLDGVGATLTLGGLVFGSVLTFAYSARFVRPFVRPLVSPSKTAAASAPAPSMPFVGPAALLGIGTVAAGVLVGPVLGTLIESAANSLDASVGDPKLSLWHGFNAALSLSAFTVGCGCVLYLARDRVERVQRALAPSLRADEVFAAALRLLNLVARRTTGFVQPGSLPVSIGVILVVVVGTPTVVLLATGFQPDWDPVSEATIHPFLASLLVVSATAVAVVRRRFAAVLLLGSVGYGMALVFAVQGAPDLAFTQFAVETLSIVVFMLVIRQLPERFQPSQFRASSVVRLAVAGFVGIGVFLLAMATSEGTAERTVSDQIVARAEPDGGGKNVVNVILVDVRGLDTLGEITVLAASAVGVVALARVGRRSPGSDPEPDRPREEIEA